MFINCWQKDSSRTLVRHDKVIDLLSERLHALGPHIDVVLYGSRARGDNRPDSDYDILILVDKPGVSKIDFSERWALYHVVSSVQDDIMDETRTDGGFEINPVVNTREQWFGRTCKSPYWHNVMKEGIFI